MYFRSFFFRKGQSDSIIEERTRLADLSAACKASTTTQQVRVRAGKRNTQMTGSINKVGWQKSWVCIAIIISQYKQQKLILTHQHALLKNVKMDCTLVPPCRSCLQVKLKRAKHVIILWMHASSASSGDVLFPTDYGLLRPHLLWIHLFGNGEENLGIAQTSSDEKDVSGFGTAQISLDEEDAYDIDIPNDEL